MSNKFKKVGLIILKFILFIFVAFGVFTVLDNTRYWQEGVFFGLVPLLSAFILGLLYRKDIFEDK